MKKLAFAVVVLTLFGAGLAFAAGEAEEPSTETVEIVFAVNETPILTSDFWSIVSNRFMEANPGVVVENIAQPSSNIMIRDYLKTLLATGQFPDIMVMASPADFVAADALMALPTESLSYLLDPEVGQINGKSYVAVYKYQVGGFWFNKTAFRELGLSEPQTFDELLSLCETIEAAGQIPISMGLKDGWPQLVLASMILSADVLAEDPEWGLKRNADEVQFSDENLVRALTKYQTLVQNFANDDLASVTYVQMLEYFFSGRALMLPMGSWVQGEAVRVNPDFEVGFFPVPSDEAADTISVWANEGLAINANTDHPEVCLDFVDFFFNDTVWYSQFLQTEMLFPGTKEVVEYEMSALREDVGAQFETLRPVEHWYDMTGDAALLPGLQAYFNKMTQRIAMGSSVEEELALYDAEWDFANSNAQ